MPERVGGKECGEQDGNRRCVERVRRHAIVAGGLQLAKDEQPDTGDEADGEPNRWRQPAVIDRIARKNTAASTSAMPETAENIRTPTRRSQSNGSGGGGRVSGGGVGGGATLAGGAAGGGGMTTGGGVGLAGAEMIGGVGMATGGACAGGRTSGAGGLTTGGAGAGGGDRTAGAATGAAEGDGAA